jgi:hypothetical protein
LAWSLVPLVLAEQPAAEVRSPLLSLLLLQLKLLICFIFLFQTQLNHAGPGSLL